MQHIENLGLKYDIVDVKPGYARNFLIPNKLVSLATAQKKKQLKKILENQIEEEKELIRKAKETLSRLKKINLTLKARVGIGNKLFGSINNQNLSDELLKAGIKIDKKYIKIPGNTIKKTGKYIAKIRLHRSVEDEYHFQIIEEIKKIKV